VPLLAGAQSPSQGQGLEISPPLAELSADPGETVEATIKVRNVTEQTLLVTAEVNDFVAAGEDGQPKLLLEEGEESPYSIKSWITTVPELTLESQEQQPVKITMTVPTNASPGGHYGVVRFSGVPPGLEGSGVSLSASIGTLVLVNISGDVVEQGVIEEVYTTDQEGNRQWFFEYGPIGLVERIRNSGNTHFSPGGTVRVTNMFNKEVGSFQLNPTGGNVLPDSVRKFEQTLDKRLMFGRYTVQTDIAYGSNNDIITQAITFWVIPYKLILLALAAIVALIIGVRQYNKYVVKRAQKKSKK
jgi:hypothetical protein